MDAWDRARDARSYPGPWPVVAHPPCGPWGGLRHQSKHQDPALAVQAVAAVRRWGGVLEHPSHSALWAHQGLPRPGSMFRDAWGGWSLQVDQVWFGHPARKRTWLYLVGVEPEEVTLEGVDKSRRPTHTVGGDGVARPNLWSEASRLTTWEFAEWLLRIAEGVSRPG